MKRNSLIFAFIVGTFSLLSMGAFAQTDTARVISQNEIKANKQAAKELARESEDQVKTEARDGKDKLNDMEALEKENKAKAKEARRVNSDASDAARQSKRAANAERNAQRARKQADKQAGKATKATE